MFGDICIPFPVPVEDVTSCLLIGQETQPDLLIGRDPSHETALEGHWDLLTEFDLKQFHSETVPVRSQIELFVIA